MTDSARPIADNSPDDLSPAALEDIERRTQAIGLEIFDRLDARRPNVLDRRWWDDRIMSWAMQDEAVKVQLFRFVDVLPMLRSDDQMIRHLTEYLAEVRERMPYSFRIALGVARRAAFTRGAVARAARLSVMDFARRFIAGSDAKEVLAAAQRERKLRRAFTLDILGEAVISEREADEHFTAYCDLIRNVAPTVNSWEEIPQIDRDHRGALPRMNLSVKLSALDSQFDAVDQEGTLRRCGARLRELLRVARSEGAFINVDMESYEKKDLTLRIFQSVLQEPEFRDFVDAGIVIQCYLYDAARDLRELRDWAVRRGAPVWVRLVKGAYWDYETIHHRYHGWPVPVFQEKWRSDANFEAAARFVMQNHEHLRPALGSHNIRSLAHGLATAKHLELPQNAFEVQMLYGMADSEKRAVVEMGHRLRIYMPYGELIPGMAYLVRRLLENTSNDSFLRSGFEENVSPEELLRNPNECGMRSAECEMGDAGDSEATQDSAFRTSHSAFPTAHPSMVMNIATTEEPILFTNYPRVEFTRAESRQAMVEALDRVREKLGVYRPLFLDGEEMETPERLVSLDPSHKDRVVGETGSAEQPHVQQAVEAAKRALPAWRDLGVEQRAKYLQDAAAIMQERFFELTAWEVFECAKGWREAAGDVCEAIDFCNYYAGCALALQRTVDVNTPGEENRWEYQPRGVAAVIAPWNFPLAILTGMTVASLVTGNTVIMKPAEQSPIVGSLVMDIFRELDLPPGVLQYLPGRGETAGAALVEHPDVALIAFTGSRQVGLSINVKAAEISAGRNMTLVKKVIAEMGGKNAIIIDDDADLDEAVMGVIKSAFGYQGQKCSACSRAIVLEGIYDAFLNRLVEAARSLKIGPAEDPATSVSAVIDEEAYNRIRAYIELGRKEGRELLAVDVGELTDVGYYIGPHIFADISPEAQIAQEEIFGPVLAVMKAKDLDEAFSIFNNTLYALTGGMYSRSPGNLDRAQRELHAGNLYLNRNITGALVSRQPFGGYKMSGIGAKAGGPDYLLQYVIPRTITENTMRRGFAPME
ncbi:MAG: proline dehydrogenase family protein [Planctomycetes bacterium]|nr:proline dehydrogenase family protein [Planctomycetota bacterium]